MTPQATPTRSASPTRRLILVVSVGLLAFVLTAVVGGIWTALLAINLATGPTIPWAVAVMALLLWLLWRYLGGAGWPRGTTEARRQFLRARRAPGQTFAWAVGAGLLAIVALAGMWFVLFQLAHLPPVRALPDTSKYPLVTVALALVMASLVGAVAEETAFHGYFQGILEGTVGGVAAILITALVMAPEHALTQGFVWPTLAFYLVVDVMLGASALLTRSILPGIMTHATGLLIFFTLVWPGDVIRQVVGGTTGLWFLIHAAQTLVFAVLTVLAFIHLARISKQSHKDGNAPIRA